MVERVQLSPVEACAQLLKDHFTFPEFMELTGMAWPEMLKELQVGTLNAFRLEGSPAPYIDNIETAGWLIRHGMKPDWSRCPFAISAKTN